MLKPFSLDTPGNFLRIFIMFSRMCSNEGQVWNSSAPWVVSVALSACGAPLMEHHFKEQRITCAPSAKALLVCILCLSAWDFFIIYLFLQQRSVGCDTSAQLCSSEAPQGLPICFFFLCTNYLFETGGENEERCRCNWLCNVTSKRRRIRLFNRSFTALKLNLSEDGEGKAARPQ